MLNRGPSTFLPHAVLLPRAAQCVALALLVSWIYSFFSGVLLHQLAQPVWAWLYADPGYWALFLSPLPDWLLGSYAVSLTFDITLLFLILWLLGAPEQVWAARLLFILFGVYVLLLNATAMHHASNRAGLWWMLLPFCVSGGRSRAWIWQSLRYYTLFIFVSAAAWKMGRASFFHADQGWLILQKNWIGYVYHHPTTWLSKTQAYLFAHPSIPNVLYRLAILAELTFVIGFFTKKWDPWLIVLGILLCTGFWWMADAFIFELLVLFLTLMPSRYFMTTDAPLIPVRAPGTSA